MTMNKVVFFSTSSRTADVLEAVSKICEISLVVTKVDKIIGRSKIPTSNDAKKFALKNNLPLFEIDKFDLETKNKLQETLNAIKPDICLTIDFGFIVPKNLFDIPKYGFINTHFSLLPKYRGASAVQFAILNDDKDFGITYHLIDATLDTGDIIYQSVYPLDENLNSGQGYEFLFKKCSQELPQVVLDYISGKLKTTTQDHTKAIYTYSKTNPKHTFIFKEDAVIEDPDTERQIFRKVKAYNPWPLLRASLSQLQRLNQFKNLELKNQNDVNLKIVDARFSNGSIEITEVVIENGKRLNSKDLISGYFKK